MPGAPPCSYAATPARRTASRTPTTPSDPGAVSNPGGPEADDPGAIEPGPGRVVKTWPPHSSRENRVPLPDPAQVRLATAAFPGRVRKTPVNLNPTPRQFALSRRDLGTQIAFARNQGKIVATLLLASYRVTCIATACCHVGVPLPRGEARGIGVLEADRRAGKLPCPALPPWRGDRRRSLCELPTPRWILP